MAPRAKTSASKKTDNDASSLDPVLDRGSKSQPSDSANLQVQVEELENAVMQVISLVDQGRGTFADLKQSLSDCMARIQHQGEYRLAIRCSMRLLDMELLLTKLENLRQVNLESDVTLFLASARHRAMWQRECRRQDIEDQESLISRLDLRQHLLQTDMESTISLILLDMISYAQGELI